MATHHSCLESPMDRVALRAAGHMVTQTQTGLKQLRTHAQISLWAYLYSASSFHLEFSLLFNTTYRISKRNSTIYINCPSFRKLWKLYLDYIYLSLAWNSKNHPGNEILGSLSLSISYHIFIRRSEKEMATHSTTLA